MNNFSFLFTFEQIAHCLYHPLLTMPKERVPPIYLGTILYPHNLGFFSLLLRYDKLDLQVLKQVLKQMLQ